MDERIKDIIDLVKHAEYLKLGNNYKLLTLDEAKCLLAKIEELEGKIKWIRNMQSSG